VAVPASGQIFNVSALVVPEAMPARNDGQDMLPEFDKLVEYARLQLERQRVKLRREELKVERKARRERARRRGPARPHVPQIKELREWSSCRAYFQRLEREVRRDLQLGDDHEVTKEMLHAAGAPAVRTITRIMVETYGLVGDQWPPSTWPDDL
jgi:hypothetical protein